MLKMFDINGNVETCIYNAYFVEGTETDLFAECYTNKVGGTIYNNYNDNKVHCLWARADDGDMVNWVSIGSGFIINNLMRNRGGETYVSTKK